MIDWVQIGKERLAKMVDEYKAEHDKDTIEIPVYDFFIMLESLIDVCSEWSGSSVVNEIRYPVYEKYRNMNKEV